MKSVAGIDDRLLASIPSPTRSVWHLGPLPVRAYALCIIVGIVVALWVATRRWRERGGDPDHVWDVAGWAIVFGIVGGRLYHVLTDPELYFGSGRHPLDALKIWDGGLGIWGAIALGGVGAWIGCRRRGIRLAVFADACIPGVVFAQAIGRLGNWFNNELYGAPTDLPWGLEIHNLSIETGRSNGAVIGTFQPTFLYELLWDAAVGVALILLDRRLRLGRGNVLALYVMGYTLGRFWIELLRRDDANHILGLRLNVWTSIVVFLLGLAYFLRHGGFRAEREASPYQDSHVAVPVAADPAPAGQGAPEADEEVAAERGHDD
nr:prolipoprotein diacylglyceryl transferase [Jatrophihabitans endophyticus]